MLDKIKKLVATFKSMPTTFRGLPINTKRLLGLGMTVALVLALPVFIWGVVTQRFNFLNKAASGETTGEPPTPSPIQTVMPSPPGPVCKTGVDSWVAGDACKLLPSGTGMMSAKYQCYDSATWYTATLGRCATATELMTISSQFCANRSNCTPTPVPTPKPTPTRTPVPTPTVVPKPTLTPIPCVRTLINGVFVMRCPPTPSSTPVPTPVPTPTPTSTSKPVISTTVMPVGSVNKYYNGIVNGYEIGSRINLYMTFSSLPAALFNGGCVNGFNQKETMVACRIVGYPKARGVYYINARIFDQFGKSSQKVITLFILPWWFW